MTTCREYLREIGALSSLLRQAIPESRNRIECLLDKEHDRAIFWFQDWIETVEGVRFWMKVQKGYRPDYPIQPARQLCSVYYQDWDGGWHLLGNYSSYQDAAQAEFEASSLDTWDFKTVSWASGEEIVGLL